MGGERGRQPGGVDAADPSAVERGHAHPLRLARPRLLLAAPACGDDESEPAGLEEFCRLDANAKSESEKCGPLLRCNYFYSFAKPDIDADAGHCANTCTDDADCPGGQVCLSQACFYTCNAANCPREWMSCAMGLFNDDLDICVGAPP